MGGNTAGSDGALWFTETSLGKIGRITTSGSLTQYSLPTGTQPTDITAGPDGNLWYTAGGTIGRITTAGVVTQWTLPGGSSATRIGVGPDANSLWFTDSNNNIGRITLSGSVSEVSIPTANSGPGGITLGPDGKIWFVEGAGNKVARLDWIEQAAGLQSDPLQGTLNPIPGQPGSSYSPVTGNLRVTVPIDFMLQSGNSDCGCNPFLVYNSETVNVRPIIAVQLMGVLGDSVPTSLQAQLTWNNGTPQSWVTLSTSGLSTSTSSYSFALQVASPVTQTGVYPWQVEVKATLSGGTVIDRTLTGYSPVVVLDSTTSGQVDPYGPGWSVRGVDSLVPISANGSVPAGVLYVFGSGGSRFYQSEGNGTYLSPSNDMGTLSSSTSGGVTTYTCTTKDQIVYTFNSAGQLLTMTFPQQLTKTFSYSSGLLTAIQEPDGGQGTFNYSGGILSTIQETGGRTVTVSHTANGSLNDLTSVQFPDNSLRTFTYDSAHRMLSDTRTPLAATFAYDSTSGRLATITLAGGQTTSVKPAAVTDLAGGLAANGQPQNSFTNALSQTTTVVADFLSRVLSLTGADGSVWQYTRDFAGNVVTATDPRNNVTTYSYQYGSGLGDLIKVQYPDGTSTQYSYDPTWHEPTVIMDRWGSGMGR